MAKEKEQSSEDTTSFLGKDIDPELLNKVDEYMDIKEPDPEVVPEAPMEFEPPSSEDIASAPLLPSEKLPNLEGKKKSTSKKDLQETPPFESSDKQQKDAKASLPLESTRETDKEDSGEQQSIAEETAERLPRDELGLEDPQTEKAVDEIIAAEADELIEAGDNRRAKENETVPKTGLRAKVKAFFSAWWHNKKYRNTTLAIGFFALVIIAIVPSTRYYALNSIGVRASSSVVVLDEKTNLPLKNVEFTIAGMSDKTDRDGRAKVEKIKLGDQAMVINKPGFARIDRKLTVGWGSNPLGETKLTPTGTQYTFLVSDFLSQKPITKAEANSGESSARASTNGEIVLTVPQTDQDDIEVIISADEYRTETLKVVPGKKDSTQLLMVPAKKHAFITKRTGTFDLYKIDVDGKDEQKVLSGTGRERQDTMALVPHPKKNLTALVSVRDNIKNGDGFLLSSLNVIDLEKDEVKKVTDSERIQIIDWVGDKLVYVKITQGASEANVNRHKLMSYDVRTESEKELASTNYFNDVLIDRGSIYYSPAVYKVNGAVGLFKIDADGNNKKTVYDKEVWNLLRTEYDRISVSVGQDWYELTPSTGAFAKTNVAPPLLKSRIYVDNQDGQKSLWVDERDGKGVLVVVDVNSKQETVLRAQGGLKNPITWVDTAHAVYRVANGQETADYIISLSGGEPRKIRDVTNVAGVDRWYYY
jgi:hypothetical protein